MVLGNKSKKEYIEIDSTELSPAQIRLIKSLNNLITHVITTEEEGDFFDCSAECMRTCASLIKQSAFATDLTDQSEIPYADQAIEYSMDVLQETMNNSKVVAYDN